MAKYHDIDCELWEDLLETSPEQKLLYIFLFSNSSCRPSGIYKIKFKTMNYYTDCSKETVESMCGKLIEYDWETGEIWVKGKLKRFLSGLRSNMNVQKSVMSDLSTIKSEVIKSLFLKKYEGALKGLSRGLQAPCKGSSTSKSTSKSKEGDIKGENGLTPERDSVRTEYPDRNHNNEPFSSPPPPEFLELRARLSQKMSLEPG